MHDTLFQDMAKSIIDGDIELAERLAQKSIDEKIPPLDAINKGFVTGVNKVGDEFSAGNAFLPELVMAGEAMKAAIEVLEPEQIRLGTRREVLGKIVLATVEGDIHDIGKTLVGTMMAASGFEVHDLGVDVPISKIIGKAIEVDADLIGVSALLTTTMVKQREVVAALKETGLNGKVKLMIGGAPVTREWMDEIGADAFSEDAISAVAAAKELLGKN